MEVLAEQEVKEVKWGHEDVEEAEAEGPPDLRVLLVPGTEISTATFLIVLNKQIKLLFLNNVQVEVNSCVHELAPLRISIPLQEMRLLRMFQS